MPRERRRRQRERERERGRGQWKRERMLFFFFFSSFLSRVRFFSFFRPLLSISRQRARLCVRQWTARCAARCLALCLHVLSNAVFPAFSRAFSPFSSLLALPLPSEARATRVVLGLCFLSLCAGLPPLPLLKKRASWRLNCPLSSASPFRLPLPPFLSSPLRCIDRPGLSFLPLHLCSSVLRRRATDDATFAPACLLLTLLLPALGQDEARSLFDEAVARDGDA